MGFSTFNDRFGTSTDHDEAHSGIGIHPCLNEMGVLDAIIKTGIEVSKGSVSAEPLDQETGARYSNLVALYSIQFSSATVFRTSEPRRRSFKVLACPIDRYFCAIQWTMPLLSTLLLSFTEIHPVLEQLISREIRYQFDVTVLPTSSWPM